MVQYEKILFENNNKYKFHANINSLVKALHVEVFIRHSHAFQIFWVSDTLEISAANQEIYLHACKIEKKYRVR